MPMTGLNEIENELRILVIDGTAAALDFLKESLLKEGSKVYAYRVHHCEPTRQNSIDRCRADIAALINSEAINVIIAAHRIGDSGHIAEGSFEITEFFSDGVTFENHRIIPERLLGIKKVVIHTYDPEMNWESIRNIEDKINKVLERGITFFIELSSSFTKYDFLNGIQYDNPELLPLENKLRHSYNRNFSAILVKILEEVADPDGSLHEFSEQFDALEKIKNLDYPNKKLISELRNKGQEQLLETTSGFSTDLLNAIQLFEFKLGHVTFISDIKDNQETHLLDIPYKNYYDKVNSDLEKKPWTLIYKDNEGKFLDDQAVYFDYQFDGNEFQLFQFWESDRLKELAKSQDIKKFLPYLHTSIFYDENAWKLPVRPINKTTCTKSIKLFFLFSRLSNRSFSSVDKLHSHLNFSIWSIGSDSYDSDQVKSLAGIIRQTYFWDIKDIVQGTVTLTIMDHIKKIEQEKIEQLLINQNASKQLEFVKAHKHTIRNFGYEEHLANLKLALRMENIPIANEVLGDIEKLNLLRDITIDFIYRTDEPIHKLLLYVILEKRGFLYSEILSIIANGKSLSRPNLFIDNDVKDHPVNQIRKEDMVDVFNLLVNLYSNTLTHSNGKYDFKISLKIEKEQLVIDFVTNTKLEDIYSNYLLDPNAVKPSEGQGLTIIKDSINRLNEYVKLYISRFGNQNTLTLKIT
jgi:hypothetical protein